VKSNRWTFWGLAVFLALCSPPTFGHKDAAGIPGSPQPPKPPKDGARPRIVIWVYNYAQVPQQTLADAETEVGKILARAGVSADWIKCPVSVEEVQANPVCQDRMGAAELALIILSKVDPTPERQAADSYFGYAQVFSGHQFGHYAYVSYDQIRDPALRGPASVSQMLGHVATHELGHVLLRSIAHSSSGLMRAKWDRSDLEKAAQGQLNFTQEQGKLLRAEALARGK
jgi:hypothetical protein